MIVSRCDECNAETDMDRIYFLTLPHEDEHVEMHFCTTACLQTWVTMKQMEESR